MLLTRPILARASTNCPRYITANWAQVVPQKSIYMCQDKQNMLSNHTNGVKWSALCLHVANDSCTLKRHSEGGKKFFFVKITNFIHILEQCHMVILTVVQAFIRHCSFQICSHIHPTSFDAGLKYLPPCDGFEWFYLRCLQLIVHGWALGDISFALIEFKPDQYRSS